MSATRTLHTVLACVASHPRRIAALPLTHAGITEDVMSDRDELDQTVSVRFPAKVRAQLERLAAADDRRLSQVVRRIVVRALETNDEGLAA
jgi:hypothetical protein